MNPYDTPLIGDSMPMQKLRALIARIAPSKVPILIEGETGTGKELVAASLHRQSGRDGAFVAFNVCALSESMFEDALFGHSKGAFTGAVGETPGFLREANGGTVFLDEISGLPLAHQAKLLRAIETGVVRPVGSSRDALTDFRLIVATNERLDDLVEQGRFRTDLAHRVCGLVLTVPALAERVDDIPALVEHFVHRARPKMEVAPAAIDLLQHRAWPGNVRELRQVVEAALVMSGEVLDAGAVELVLGARGRDAGRDVATTALVERQQLLNVLGTTAWDTERAAAMLGVHRATIYRRMRRLGIPVPSLGAMYPPGAGRAASGATLAAQAGRSDFWAQM